MATSLRKELAYDATPDAVAAMLADPAFREEVLERQHVLRGSASVDGSTVVVEQVQSAAGLPGFAQKFVGDEIVIVQTERWGSDTAADLHLAIPGKPGDITGTVRLTPAGAGTVEVVDLSVKVSIPLVGGKIEKLVADMIEKALAKEHEVGQEWLAR
ncbi:DUF2505 domain-containing protein [Nocardioides sp. Soil805]|uniref:DUF2505 domain-containing protein n=1 Tax=Nocardioides sp. Soil805 TaxID=1736416 RepID=UPI000703A973|nr:DUF2505 domain-containing protein [Nocardioides sp. Soil805]KRF36697.1 hypothetical protein ASG94_04540 [Nocardioides sp. Soil805]